jgi:GNAT superfamily N-acetyltransferase
MHLILREAKVSDAPALVDIYFCAFSIDAISLLCFPRNNVSAYNFWYDSIVEEIADPHSHFICVYDSDSPSQTVVAYGKWNGPAAPLSNPDELPKWPEGGDEALANHFFWNLLSRHAKIMEGRKHWYLELLATRPNYQGKGAAGKLLRWGLERADQDGTETYLEASPDGKPIYEHFGFKEVDRLVVELKGDGEGPLAEKEFIEVMMARPITAKGK